MLRQFVRSLLLEAMAPIDSKTLSAKVWGKLFSQDVWVDEHGWKWRLFYSSGNRDYPADRSDLMVTFSIEGYAPEETPPDFYGLQANLDRWHEDHGWLPLFDWVGDPMAEINTIEKELGKQFKAFVTGISMEEDFGFDLPPRPMPKVPNAKKKPFKVPPPEVTADVDTPGKKDESDDLEWL